MTKTLSNNNRSAATEEERLAAIKRCLLELESLGIDLQPIIDVPEETRINMALLRSASKQRAKDQLVSRNQFAGLTNTNPEAVTERLVALGYMKFNQSIRKGRGGHVLTPKGFRIGTQNGATVLLYVNATIKALGLAVKK